MYESSRPMPLLCFPHYMNGSRNDHSTAHLALRNVAKQKKMFLLYPLKWWVETLTGEIDVGGGVAITAALKEWSNLFWPSSVPYLNLLVNATCSLPKRKASVSSRSVESTHRICCSFISREREKKKKEYTVNTYCSALLYEISLHYIQIYLMN